MTEPPLNPYAPPQSPLLDPETAPTPEELAGAGRRFANLWIDSFALNFVGLVAGAAVGSLTEAGEGPGLLATFGVGFAASVGYYATFESLTGRTLGKLVTRTRVVSASGGPATLRQILGRSLARQIPFEAFSFLVGSGRGLPPVGWHDSLSGTRVVRVRRA